MFLTLSRTDNTRIRYEYTEWRHWSRAAPDCKSKQVTDFIAWQSRCHVTILHWETESEKYIILTLFYDHNYVNLSNLTKSSCFWKSPKCLVRDSSVVRRHYIFLLEPLDVRELCIRKTADLLLQLWVSTFPRFVAIGFYFLSETLI